MVYKVQVNGQEIVYGPYVTRSRFSSEEWKAIHKEMIRKNYDEKYEEKLNDEDFIYFAGECIDLSERYEALLELLPQSTYSKAGTHPIWIANEVEENTLRKYLTRDDVAMFIEESETLEELKEELKEYFKIKPKV